MFMNDDCNSVNLSNDAVVPYKNNIQSFINKMTVDASNNPEKIRYYISEVARGSEDNASLQIGVNKHKPMGKHGYGQLQVGDSVKSADNRKIVS